MGVTLNRQALRHVREQRGLDISQVADFASISLQRLSDFEEGKREPTRKQAERLAETYGIPLYSLFGSAIPDLPSSPQDFRKRTPTPSILSPKGVRALLAAERISEFSKQLSLELGYTPKDLSRSAKLANSTKKRATILRQAFDEWHQPRATDLGFTGSTEQRFLGALRLFFEIQGGIVNINDAPSDEFMGFFIRPRAGLPVIFVNRTISSKKAQLFTLAHEYSHALMGEDGISNPFRPHNIIERACNVFAAEFLAPMDDFIKIVETLPRQIYADTDRLISAASSATLLSKHASAIRLLESDHIKQADFRAWRRIFAANPRREKDEEKALMLSRHGVPHAKRLSEIGHLPVLLAKQALDKNLLDTFDVADGLGLSRTIQDRAYALATRRFEIALK